VQNTGVRARELGDFGFLALIELRVCRRELAEGVRRELARVALGGLHLVVVTHSVWLAGCVGRRMGWVMFLFVWGEDPPPF
jgi:hypothetical protein